MRINEVLNSKYYITEEDTMTLADVQVMYGDDPEMMAAIQKAKMLPKIKTWDQAIDKASAEMRRLGKNTQTKPDREFATNRRAQGWDDETHGHLRKQRAKQAAKEPKGMPTDGEAGEITGALGKLGKSVAAAASTIRHGSIGDVGTAIDRGRNVGKDALDTWNVAAKTKRSKDRGGVIGSR